MSFKDVLKNNPFTVLIILLATLISGITFVFSKFVAIIELLIIIVVVIASLKHLTHISARKKDMLRSPEKTLLENGEISSGITSFPFAYLIANRKGDIEWFNSEFEKITEIAEEKYTNDLFSLIPAAQKVFSEGDFRQFELNLETTQFTVFPSVLGDNYVFYFVNDTELKIIREEYNITRPSVLLLNLDSLEQTEDVMDHADYYSVVSDIEREITKWLVDNKAIFRKYADGKFIAITESLNLDRMIKNKFKIIDKVRMYRYGDSEVDITLSVGVGREKSFSDSENSARQALDLARGRGGDQAVVKNGDSYEFFGGTTSRKEKRGKIKSRTVAAALEEFVENCSSVFIMGHTYSDFDAIGAAVGLSAIVKSCSKPAYIIVNQSTTFAKPLIKRIAAAQKTFFISPESAAEIIQDDSLVIVTDTMRSHLVEAPKLLDGNRKIILIDHHRKTVDHIDSLLEFHEPYASSACEMVTELIQYSPSKPKLTSFEAEALLAGIILDTKNFSMRVGVRTFEAAAYLKDCKADTVAVRKLFAGTAEENILIKNLMANAKFVKNFAICMAEPKENISRLAASKAADELLNIEGIDASFVITAQNDTVNISSRSLGYVNVQLIMEHFGGGGHQSMAACQIKDSDIYSVSEMLVDYLESQEF